MVGARLEFNAPREARAELMSCRGWIDRGSAGRCGEPSMVVPSAAAAGAGPLVPLPKIEIIYTVSVSIARHTSVAVKAVVKGESTEFVVEIEYLFISFTSTVGTGETRPELVALTVKVIAITGRVFVYPAETLAPGRELHLSPHIAVPEGGLCPRGGGHRRVQYEAR